MNITAFRAIKDVCRGQVHQLEVEHQNEPLRSHEFALLLLIALKNRITSNILNNGLKRGGLFHWNPKNVDDIFPSTDHKIYHEQINKSVFLSTEDFTKQLMFLESFIGKQTLELFQKQL